jgi:tRNA-dihydrouridine synthase
VKFRNPPAGSKAGATDLARVFEDAGADALVFHPRTSPDVRTRPPVWEHIAQVKAAVRVPVFGNGNVFTPESCLRMLRLTGCDGVAVGRLAAARPWIFGEWTGVLGPDKELPVKTAKAMAELCVLHFDLRRALLRYRKWSAYFAANFRFGHYLWKQVRSAEDVPDALEKTLRFLAEGAEISAVPNANLFA